MSLRFRLFEFGSRLFIKAPMRWIKKPTHLRSYLDFVTRLNSGTPRGAKFEQIMLNAEGKNVPALKVLSDQGQSQRILLYVHGGGYLFGSSDVYKGMVTHMVRRLGFDAVIPDYALAPENPFPAGFNDVVASYLGLLKMGFDSHQISLMGDSAGGNLICSLLDHLLQNKIDLPASAVILAAQTDFTMKASTIQKNSKSEAVLASQRFDDLTEHYLQGADPADRRASPINGDFTGSPPVQIQVAKHELLYGDNIAMAEKMRRQRVSVDLIEYDHGFHVFQMMAGKIPESDAALDSAAKFILKHL
jgi:acetyl esterase/lipase